MDAYLQEPNRANLSQIKHDLLWRAAYLCVTSEFRHAGIARAVECEVSGKMI